MHRTLSLAHYLVTSSHPVRAAAAMQGPSVPLLGLVTRTLMAVTLKSSSSSFVRSIGEKKSESSEWSGPTLKQTPFSKETRLCCTIVSKAYACQHQQTAAGLTTVVQIFLNDYVYVLV